MGKPLRIHGNVLFDARYLLTRVITLLFCGICIFRALCINNHKACLLWAPCKIGMLTDKYYITH